MEIPLATTEVAIQTNRQQHQNSRLKPISFLFPFSLPMKILKLMIRSTLGFEFQWSALPFLQLALLLHFLKRWRLSVVFVSFFFIGLLIQMAAQKRTWASETSSWIAWDSQVQLWKSSATLRGRVWCLIVLRRLFEDCSAPLDVDSASCSLERLASMLNPWQIKVIH